MATTVSIMDLSKLTDGDLRRLARETHDEQLRRGMFAFVAPDAPCVELRGAGLLRGES